MYFGRTMCLLLYISSTEDCKCSKTAMIATSVGLSFFIVILMATIIVIIIFFWYKKLKTISKDKVGDVTGPHNNNNMHSKSRPTLDVRADTFPMSSIIPNKECGNSSSNDEDIDSIDKERDASNPKTVDERSKKGDSLNHGNHDSSEESESCSETTPSLRTLSSSSSKSSDRTKPTSPRDKYIILKRHISPRKKVYNTSRF